jgi:hypothetical protein
VRTRTAPPSITPFCPISSPIRYCYSIPTLSRCLYAPCPPMFAGPSPGTRARHHGRHHSSSPAMLRHCSLSTSPTIMISESWRCRIGPVLPRPNPRRRREHVGQTRRPTSWAIKGTPANTFSVLGSLVQETKGLFASLLFSVSCQLVKLIGNCRKLQKLSN